MDKQPVKKENKLKAIWSSNAVHTNSGYAVETRDVAFRLKKSGFDIDTLGFWGVDGYPVYLYGQDLIGDRFKDVKLKVYPKMADPYGADALVAHATANKHNVAFTMQDVQTLDPAALNELNTRGIKFIPYMPIDQETPPQVILNNLKFAYKIITFSQFGQKTLANSGFTSTLIPEGIDTEIFKPMNQKESRRKFGLPEEPFIFGMIGANKENPPRKGYQEALEAFKILAEKYKDVAIFFHSQQLAPGGFPIQDYAKHLGIADRCLFLNQYAASYAADSHKIAEEINCFDAQLHPSQTEGFGLLVVEAQACGLPVIVNDCHSMPELIVEGVTGEICKTAKPWWRSLNGYVYPADVNSLAEKMEKVYLSQKNTSNRKKTAKAAREHILKNYNIDAIVNEKWIPFFKELEEELST